MPFNAERLPKVNPVRRRGGTRRPIIIRPLNPQIEQPAPIQFPAPATEVPKRKAA